MGDPTLCVYCRRRPVEARYRPFCSDRCRLLDLASWVDGTYRIASGPLPPEDENEPRQPDS